MSKTAKIVIGIIVIVLVVWGISSSRGTKNSETIKIGYFGPFTGPVAGTSGEDIANSVKLAESMNNMAGDKKVEVIYEDDACDPKKAASAVQKLIEVDKVDLLISGVCSGPTLAAAPIAESNKIPMLALAATSPAITTAGEYIFRTSASSVLTAEAVSVLLQNIGYKSIAIIFETADYTVGWKDSLIKSFSAIPGNTVKATESFTSTDTDLRTQLAKINQAKADLIVVVPNSTVTANNVVNQARDLGITTPIIGNEYMAYPQVVTNPKAEGIMGTIYKYDSNSVELKNLLTKYNERFGKMPNLEVYSGLAYDGYNVLLKAIEKCNGAEAECIKQALYDTQGYQGVMGTISIDSNGDTKREFTLKKITGGKLVDIK